MMFTPGAATSGFWRGEMMPPRDPREENDASRSPPLKNGRLTPEPRFVRIALPSTCVMRMTGIVKLVSTPAMLPRAAALLLAMTTPVAPAAAGFCALGRELHVPR